MSALCLTRWERGRRCRLYLALVVLVGLVAGASHSEPAFGISRVDGRGACFSALPGGRCPAMRGVFGASGWANDLSAMAASPDGRSLYVVALGRELGRDIFRGPRDSSLLTFARDPVTGRLRQLLGRAGCVSARRHGGCRRARGMSYTTDVWVAPDGRFVYVAGQASRGVAVFARDQRTGALRQLPGRSGCLVDGRARDGCASAPLLINEPRISVDLSLHPTPDGRTIYLYGRPLSRDPSTGTVAPPIVGSCAPGVIDQACGPLEWIPAVEFSHDGRHAYDLLPTGSLRALIPEPLTGAFQPLPGSPPCYPVATDDGCDREGAQHETIQIAPDDRNVYVTLGVDDAIVTYLRDATSGVLTRRPEVARCGGRSTRPPCRGVGHGLADLVFSPDGSTVYAILSTAVVGYRRDAETGVLAPLPWPEGCVTANRPSRGCGRLRFADHERGIASPDGRFLIVLGLATLTVYRL